MSKNIDTARKIIHKSVKFNKSIFSVLGQLELTITLTDNECKKLAKESIFSYEHIRNAFD